MPPTPSGASLHYGLPYSAMWQAIIIIIKMLHEDLRLGEFINPLDKKDSSSASRLSM